MDYNDKKSVCINNLRFPLILGVVLIHNRIIEPSAAFNEGFLFLGLFIDVFSHKLVASCVPLFFFFSGYLFFVKYADGFSANDYFNQLRKRMRTLLVPFIFWNAIVMGYFALIHKFAPGIINSEFNNVYHFSVVDFMLGAGFAIHKYDFVIFAEKCRIIAMPLFLFCIILSSGGVKGILTISGALILVYIATLFNASRCIYTKSGFFVYAFHGFPILILSKVIVMIFQPSNSIM